MVIELFCPRLHPEATEKATNDNFVTFIFREFQQALSPAGGLRQHGQT